MTESAAGCAGGGDIAEELDDGGIARRGLGEGAFNAVDDGREGNIADEGIVRGGLHGADGGADLLVVVGGDVLHQEVDDAGVALQDAEDLQGPVGGFEGWRWGR